MGPYFWTKACSTRLSLSPRIDRCHEFVAHAVGIRAADVVAFQKNLVAAADAHHLMADFIEARGRIAAPRGEDGETGGRMRAAVDRMDLLFLQFRELAA